MKSSKTRRGTYGNTTANEGRSSANPVDEEGSDHGDDPAVGVLKQVEKRKRSAKVGSTLSLSSKTYENTVHPRLLLGTSDTDVGEDDGEVVGDESRSGPLREEADADDDEQTPPVAFGLEEVEVIRVGVAGRDKGARKIRVNISSDVSASLPRQETHISLSTTQACSISAISRGTMGSFESPSAWYLVMRASASSIRPRSTSHRGDSGTNQMRAT